MPSQPPKPPSFTGLPGTRLPLLAIAAVLVAAAVVRPAMSQSEPPSVPQSGPTGSVYQRPRDGAEEQGNAERIVAAALTGLGRAQSLSARVRQLARVEDVVLKGGGRSIQSGTGDEQRFRFESKLTADTEAFDVLEVNDGLYSWSYRKLGRQPPRLTRIDTRRVRERLGTFGIPEQETAAPYLGGVQRSLALVREWFCFDAVSSGMIDDVPIWIIDGQWDRDRLATLLPEKAEAIKGPAGITAGDLPEGMPWSVRLSIGKRELFPFRIEWLAIPGRRPVAATTPEVVAVLELYEVRVGDPVDATAFVYKPATEGLLDVSENYVNALQPLRP
ncbi:MAG: hypothetical protein ACK52C_02460 [Planctomycetia bacterium]